MKKKYFVVTFKSVPTRNEDLLTELCISAGAQGLSEVLQFRQESLKYEPETIATTHHDLEAFFTAAPAAEFLDEVRARFPAIEFTIREEEERDWLEEWKKGYEPFCLTKGLWVVPSWRPRPPEAQSVLWIDPGMAFGTGTHATTRLAAGLLGEQTLSGCSVLDVGTGTGILAMAARQFGAARVVATEIDADARQVARENVERNHLSAIEIPDLQIEKVAGTFDVVVANIIDGVLVDLKSDLIRCVRPGGSLVLTGILQEREAGFRSEFDWQSAGLKLIERRQDEEWVGFWLRKAAT